jgi:hypothetical protein
MEITGTLELSGIERLIIDKKEIWIRQTTKSGQFVWQKMGDGTHKMKYRPHEKILRAIRGYVVGPRHRVWVHGDTVNVERRKTKKIQILYGGHVIAEPDIVRVTLGRPRRP